MTDSVAGTLVSGVDFVTMPAHDVEVSANFYGEILGLPFVKRWGELAGIEFQAGNLTIAIMEPTKFGQEFTHHGVPLALHVEDVAAAKEELEAKGVQFVTEVFDSGVCHQAMFLDPAGNVLAIHHRYAP